MKHEFKKGDEVIWDSGHGYDIGTFVGEGVMYYTYAVNMHTGVVTGECSYPVNEIRPYSTQLIADLKKKYGYEKTFSTEF
jgi:hypothetical protein